MEVDRVDINRDDFGGAASFAFERIHAVVGADIKHTQTVQPLGQIDGLQDVLLVGNRHGARRHESIPDVERMEPVRS